MEQASPLMVVLQDAGDQEFANQLATAMGYAFADIIVGTPSDAAQAIAARGLSPAYILLDIGDMSPQEVLAHLDAMAQQCEPNTRVVVMGNVNDITLYRELKSRGVIEYFTKPAEIPSLRSAMMTQNADVMGGAVKAAGGDECFIVTFMSAASGDGSSTVALNTAYSLVREFNQPTVIIDMDYQFGMIARNLDQSSQYGIKDIFEYPDRIIDKTLIDKMLVSHLHEDNLKVIAAPNDLRVLPNIKPEVIRNLITTLKSQFKFIIIDLPHIWSPWVAAAIGEANHSVMVAQLWLRSVTHSSRMLKSWREIGLHPSKISVAINRSGAKFKEAITDRDYERVCGMDIRFALANDTKSIVSAENQGKTVSEIGTSPLAGQFKDLAGYLVALREGKPYAPEAEASSQPKPSLTSIFRKG